MHKLPQASVAQPRAKVVALYHEPSQTRPLTGHGKNDLRFPVVGGAKAGSDNKQLIPSNSNASTEQPVGQERLGYTCRCLETRESVDLPFAEGVSLLINVPHTRGIIAMSLIGGERLLDVNERSKMSRHPIIITVHRVFSSVIRLLPFAGFTSLALRWNPGRGRRSGSRFDIRIGTRSDRLVPDLTTADLCVVSMHCLWLILRQSRPPPGHGC